MVDVTIEADVVRFEVEGWDKLWAMKSQLTIPLAHISGVRSDPEAARGWFHGLRMPGTSLPGVITAGTFYQSDGVVFFDVHNADRAVVIDLDHEKFTRMVIEVESPTEVIERLNAAISQAK